VVSGRLCQFENERNEIGLRRLKSTLTSQSPRSTRGRQNRSEIIPETKQEYWRDSGNVPPPTIREANPIERCNLVPSGETVLVKGVLYLITMQYFKFHTPLFIYTLLQKVTYKL